MLRDSGNIVNPFVHESLGKMPPWTRIANGMNANIEQQHVTTNINRFPGGRTIIPRRVHYPKMHKLGAGIPTLPYGEHQQGYSQVSKNWELLPKPNRHGPMQWHRTPSKRGLSCRHGSRKRILSSGLPRTQGAEARPDSWEPRRATARVEQDLMRYPASSKH